MKTIDRIKPGDKTNSADKQNEIIDTLNALLKMMSGDGLISRQTHSGTIFAIDKPRTLQKRLAWLGGNLKELLATQGAQDTDTWDQEDNQCPVSVQIITDMQYSNLTHKIQARYRTLTFDRGGNLISISAESGLVDITTAIACTAQL